MSNDDLHDTPLRPEHEKLGARLVAFGGWRMPVQYGSILEEHQAVREAAGLFDISHMGEVVVRGPNAGAVLNRLLTNNVDKLAVGQGQYTLMLNADGGVIDDLLLYRVGEEEFFLVINAAKIDEDVAWMEAQLAALGIGSYTFEHLSAAFGAMALQGPRAEDVLSVFFEQHTVTLPGRNAMIRTPWQDLDLLIARTGYTGEDGFEIFMPAEAAGRVWEALCRHGAVLGLKAAGLGARNTLRLEACLPLNGQDLLPTHTPIEAGLGRFVSTKKEPDFPGKEVCRLQREEGPARRLVAFKMLDRGAPPREHYPLLAEGRAIGEVTSGCLSPTLGFGIGLGYVPADYATVGRRLEMQVRQAMVELEIVPKPFYQREPA
ncbi:MAG: glycine cleavage system aminomethyltransferase GcvT [Verrucomicrobiota bacterium]